MDDSTKKEDDTKGNINDNDKNNNPNNSNKEINNNSADDDTIKDYNNSNKIENNFNNENNILPNDNNKPEEDESDNTINNSTNDNDKTNNKQNSQIKWIAILMISILLIIIIVPFVTQRFINTFDYKGLEFQKTKLGELTFFSTKFPVIDLTGNVIGTYSVNLRNDPRKLEYINVTTFTDNKIAFTLNRGAYNPLYITLNPFMEICDDSVISLATLSGYLKDSGLEIRTAYTDKAFARDNNSTHRWCDTSLFDTVLIVTDGKETTINEIENGCYELKFTNCEIQQVVEKFMLVTLEEYASRFQSQ